jgi:hypothetical protein
MRPKRMQHFKDNGTLLKRGKKEKKGLALYILSSFFF